VTGWCRSAVSALRMLTKQAVSWYSLRAVAPDCEHLAVRGGFLQDWGVFRHVWNAHRVELAAQIETLRKA
jgi:hypothetical protein